MENQPNFDKAAQNEKTAATIRLQEHALRAGWDDDQLNKGMESINSKYDNIHAEAQETFADYDQAEMEAEMEVSEEVPEPEAEQ